MSDETGDFIDAVRLIPALWDKADAEFKDGKRKPQMWTDLAVEHQFEDGEAAKKRWQYLRDYYIKVKNRRVASGSAATDGGASSWPYFGAMAFLDGSLEPRKGRVSSMKSQKLVPVSSQVDPFEDLEDLDSSLGDSSKDGSSLTGAPTPKRIKQEKLALEKRFMSVMEATAQQLQAAPAEETAEELFGRTIGKKLTDIKTTNPLGVEWAMLEIQRIIYQVQCPTPQHQAAVVEQFNYTTGQGL